MSCPKYLPDASCEPRLLSLKELAVLKLRRISYTAWVFSGRSENVGISMGDDLYTHIHDEEDFDRFLADHPWFLSDMRMELHVKDSIKDGKSFMYKKLVSHIVKLLQGETLFEWAVDLLRYCMQCNNADAAQCVLSSAESTLGAAMEKLKSRIDNVVLQNDAYYYVLDALDMPMNFVSWLTGCRSVRNRPTCERYIRQNRVGAPRALWFEKWTRCQQTCTRELGRPLCTLACENACREARMIIDDDLGLTTRKIFLCVLLDDRIECHLDTAWLKSVFDALPLQNVPLIALCHMLTHGGSRESHRRHYAEPLQLRFRAIMETWVISQRQLLDYMVGQGEDRKSCEGTWFAMVDVKHH